MISTALPLLCLAPLPCLCHPKRQRGLPSKGSARGRQCGGLSPSAERRLDKESVRSDWPLCRGWFSPAYRLRSKPPPLPVRSLLVLKPFKDPRFPGPQPQPPRHYRSPPNKKTIRPHNPHTTAVRPARRGVCRSSAMDSGPVEQNPSDIEVDKFVRAPPTCACSGSVCRLLTL